MVCYSSRNCFSLLYNSIFELLGLILKHGPFSSMARGSNLKSGIQLVRNDSNQSLLVIKVLCLFSRNLSTKSYCLSCHCPCFVHLVMIHGTYYLLWSNRPHGIFPSYYAIIEPKIAHLRYAL